MIQSTENQIIDLAIKQLREGNVAEAAQTLQRSKDPRVRMETQSLLRQAQAIRFASRNEMIGKVLGGSSGTGAFLQQYLKTEIPYLESLKQQVQEQAPVPIRQGSRQEASDTKVPPVSVTSSATTTHGDVQVIHPDKDGVIRIPLDNNKYEIRIPRPPPTSEASSAKAYPTEQVHAGLDDTVKPNIPTGVRFLSGSKAGIFFPLKDKIITVGRADDNDICLEDQTVSSHHASFIPCTTGIQLRDLGSTNGTRVNGKPITNVMLGTHNLINIGAVEARYEIPDSIISEQHPQDVRKGVRIKPPPLPSHPNVMTQSPPTPILNNPTEVQSSCDDASSQPAIFNLNNISLDQLREIDTLIMPMGGGVAQCKVCGQRTTLLSGFDQSFFQTHLRECNRRDDLARYFSGAPIRRLF